MVRTEFAVIGGSYAGLSAALQLARARRDVLVVDAGLRRNRFVDEAGETAHGFLSRDGEAPGAIAAEARRQLERYATVGWMDGTAFGASVADGGRFRFRVGEEVVEAARLVLATGVRDELPDVEGLGERWGRTVFHCPYCHGYELGAGPIGIIAASPLAQHHALMLPDWGRATLFPNGAYEPTAEDLAQFARRGTAVERVPVVRIERKADVVLADGRTLSMNGLFTQPHTVLASAVAEELGCAMAQGPAPWALTSRWMLCSRPRLRMSSRAAMPRARPAMSPRPSPTAPWQGLRRIGRRWCEVERVVGRLMRPVGRLYVI